MPRELAASHFIALAAVSPYYSLFDYARMLRGIVFSGKALAREIYTADLFQAAPEIDAPVYFVEGRHDTVLSSIVAEKIFGKCGRLVVNILSGSKNPITGPSSNNLRNTAP